MPRPIEFPSTVFDKLATAQYQAAIYQTIEPQANPTSIRTVLMTRGLPRRSESVAQRSCTKRKKTVQSRDKII